MAKGTVSNQLIESHLASGNMLPGREIALKIDQTLTQDATGTLVMLELEAMGLDRIRTELSAQYVDHNLIQQDFRNPDDHLFLDSACKRFGLYFSRPGNGVSHPVHMARLGVPGKTLLGSDSHTCAAGALGMLAIGTGGLDVALAMAGEPYYVVMPEIWGVRLSGELHDWVSAKDVILEMLRRHGVSGGAGKIIEYYGPGLAGLSAMDRHVIANMGAELGATTTVFPSDDAVERFLTREGRADVFRRIVASEDAQYDLDEEIDLGQLEPLIAAPSSPGNVTPVRDVLGEPIYQAYIGSSANPGFRDLAIVARIVEGQEVPDTVSLDVNPASREILQNLVKSSHLTKLLDAGARVHQTGCNGCIGMGQAPATGQNSLRTVPRNFPGRSGTNQDRVWLCSPETAAASALRGEITDPRDLDMDYPEVAEPDEWVTSSLITPPLPPAEAAKIELRKGPNIQSLPELAELPDELELPVLLKMGDDISTDEILPAGTRVLPFRSNIEEISKFSFDGVDPTYPERAEEAGDHAVIAGDNYGQGSSREHAALAPRSLGLRVVIAKSYSRIHWQNLVNFGVLPLSFENAADYDALDTVDVIELTRLREALADGKNITAIIKSKQRELGLTHKLSGRQLALVLAGGLINEKRREHEAAQGRGPGSEQQRELTL